MSTNTTQIKSGVPKGILLGLSLIFTGSCFGYDFGFENLAFMVGDSSKVDSSNGLFSGLETEIKKFKNAKVKNPNFFGSVAYTYYFNQNQENTGFPTIANSGHRIDGELGFDVGIIPVIGRVTYDPNWSQQDPFRFSVSLNKPRFDKLLSAKLLEKPTFPTLKDSLINANQNLLLQQKITSLQYESMVNKIELVDSLMALGPPFELDRSSLDSLTRIKQEYLALLEDYKYDLNGLDNQLKNINTIVNSDSLLDAYSRMYNLRQSFKDSLEMPDFPHPLFRIKDFQIGQVFPNLSRLASYQASLKGLYFEYWLSKNTELKTYLGFRDLFTRQTAFSTERRNVNYAGLGINHLIQKKIKLGYYLAYGHSKSRTNGESLVRGINNSVLGIQFEAKPVKFVDFGGELSMASNEPDKNGFAFETPIENENLAALGFVNFRISKTSTSISYEIRNIQRSFYNYLTPMLLPNSKRHQVSLKQGLFRQNILITLKTEFRNQGENDFQATNNRITNNFARVSTNWLRAPNYFAEYLNLTSNFHLDGQEIGRVRSDLYRLGSNYRLKLKELKLFTELSYLGRRVDVNESSRLNHQTELLFRLQTKLLKWRSVGRLGWGRLAVSSFSTSLTFNLMSFLELGAQSRFQKNVHSSRWTNGLIIGAELFGFHFRATGDLSYILNSSITNQVFSVMCKYSF